ncbi:solute carrier family 44 protein member 2 [Pelomyxa schiedti]|nr:solute carrier family 44 protein member 2 [Pelomyxa schiedti]
MGCRGALCSCCCCSPAKVSDQKDVDEEYGPHASHSCTDVFFLLLFAVFWGGMVAIAVVSIQAGDVKRLTHGIDMYGNMCGDTNNGSKIVQDGFHFDMTNKSVLYWPNPLDLSVQLCLSECPSHTVDVESIALMFIPFTSDGEAARSQLICNYGLLQHNDTTSPSVWDLYDGLCWPPYKASPILGRCAPDISNISFIESIWNTFFHEKNTSDPSISSTNSSSASEETFLDGTVMMEALYSAFNAGGTFSKVLADLLKTWWIVCAFVVAAVILSWILIFLLRLFAGVIVWASIILIVAVMLLATIWVWTAASDMNMDLPDNPALAIKSELNMVNTTRIVSYILLAADFVIMLLIIVLRNRIHLAVAIFKESSKALAKMPLLTLYPVVIFVFVGILYTYWLTVSCFMATASLGQETLSIGVSVYKVPIAIKYLYLYHLFGLLWTTAFIFAVGETTVAGAISFWYWCVEKEDFPRFPITRSFKNVVVYHLGSMAFGSLILAIIQFLRILLKQFEDKMRRFNTQATKCLMRCLHCLLWVMERIVKFLNRNAYIMIAMKSQNFCRAASRAFILITSNILRVGVVSGISSFLLFVMNILVVGITTTAAAYAMYRMPDLHYWVIPVVIVGVLSYLVSSAFTTTYKVAVDTILLSFCEDSERHDGKSHCWSNTLEKFMTSRHQNSLLQNPKALICKSSAEIILYVNISEKEKETEYII